MPKLSTLCEPLRKLTLKSNQWAWTIEHDSAFETIKKLVPQAPVLKYYDVNEEVTIQCDASKDGLGCAIMQNGQPIAYASKTMTATEKRYAQIEKECLAIVYACEKFDQYILGRTATIETDHKPLEIIFKKSLLSAPKRLQRMLLRLQKYSLRVLYRAGSKMYLADFLSRAPLAYSGYQSDTPDSNYTIFQVNRLTRIFSVFENVNMCDGVGVTQFKLDLIRQATLNDDNLTVLKRVILDGWPDKKELTPQCIHHYWVFRDELSVCDNIIFRGCRVLIPKATRPMMLQRIHASHTGAESCVRKARDILFWPQMSQDIKNHVSQCEVCNELKPNQTKEPMQFHNVPVRPWSKVAIDVFTVLGRDFLVTVDFYSDFWELDELTSTNTSNIILACKSHFARYGVPDELVSDNAPQFTSTEFSEFSKSWEFSHVTSSPYYSRSNGKAESAVKIAKHLLTKCMKQKKDPWIAILEWRNIPNEKLKTSPSQRLMSRRTQTMLPMAESLLRPKTEKRVPEKILQKRVQSKQYYDRVSRPLPDLSPGETVRVKVFVKNKFWSLGKIVRQVAPRSFLVNVQGQIYRRNRSFIRTTSEQGLTHDLYDDTPVPNLPDQDPVRDVPSPVIPRRSSRIRRPLIVSCIIPRPFFVWVVIFIDIFIYLFFFVIMLHLYKKGDVAWLV